MERVLFPHSVDVGLCHLWLVLASAGQNVLLYSWCWAWLCDLLWPVGVNRYKQRLKMCLQGCICHFVILLLPWELLLHSYCSIRFQKKNSWREAPGWASPRSASLPANQQTMRNKCLMHASEIWWLLLFIKHWLIQEASLFYYNLSSACKFVLQCLNIFNHLHKFNAWYYTRHWGYRSE